MKKFFFALTLIAGLFISMNVYAQNNSSKKVLVVYFSQSGNTREIANQIHGNVGGDIFEIQTEQTYPSSYVPLTKQAKKEQESNYHPPLKTKVKNFQSYDIIFIGYPNWWGTMPMPLFTFFSEYNFSGKTIIPFCTHEGSGLGRSESDIKKLCPQSKLLEGLAIRGGSVKKAQSQVTEWLRKIGMGKK